MTIDDDIFTILDITIRIDKARSKWIFLHRLPIGIDVAIIAFAFIISVLAHRQIDDATFKDDITDIFFIDGFVFRKAFF